MHGLRTEGATGGTVACTIVAKNYLPYARTLMASVAKWHPEWARIVILVDKVDGYFDPSTENFEIILSTGLDLPRPNWFHFKYNILELSTAVKPYALRKLLRERGFDGVVYLDPDIQLYNPLDPVTRALPNSDILLTPHLTGPIADDKCPSELDILRSGVYNLGFLALGRRPSAMSFLDWWCDRLKDKCVIAPEAGLFVDQRWCDLAPGLFEDVAILRDPGLNVAYWNIHSRSVALSNGRWRVNGEPLYFFHYSGLDPKCPDRFSRHQDRFRLADIPPIRDLVRNYCGALFRSGYEKCKRWPYRYGFLEDKTPVPDLLRPILDEKPVLIDTISDPFAASGFEQICGAWNEPAYDPAGPPFFTLLALRVYNLRADLRAAYPDVYGRDRKDYLGWLASNLAREYGIPGAVAAPFRSALAAFGGKDRAVGAASDSRPGATAAEADQRIILRTHALKRFIHDSRPDLRRAFPDPLERDRLGYLTWLCTYGAVEYAIDTDLMSVVRREWEFAANANCSRLHVLWRKLRRAAYAVSARISARL